MPLIKNVLKPLAKRVLIPLRLTAAAGAAAAAATDSALYKNLYGSGARPYDLAKRETLVTSNEEMNGIRKIIKSSGESFLLIKRRL